MSDPTPSPSPASPGAGTPGGGASPADAQPSASTGPEAAAAQAPAPESKPAAAKAAVKPPAPEDAPFASFIPDTLLPALAREILSYGGPEPTLSFMQGAMPVVGADCWMVAGELPGERRFWLCFTSNDINAAKTIAVAESGAAPTLLESFLIDEKKMSLALLVSRLVQRLNGQKWLGPN